MAFQIVDLLSAMEADQKGKPVRELRVDGGASVNDLLMQTQADFLGRSVVRPRMTETTILGAAFLGGLGVGFWKDLKEIEDVWAEDTRFNPSLPAKERASRNRHWRSQRDRA